MKFKQMNTPMRVVLSFFNVIGITLAPFGIYFEDLTRSLRNKRLINHESIHWKQQIEMLIVFFYLWYLIEWLIRLFMPGNAYRNLSFEREAHQHDTNLIYLETRKLYAWRKYLKLKNQ